jgi:hypothetical protein
MGFFSTIFGGPSSQEKNLAAQSQSLATGLSNAFQQRLGAQNQIYQNLNQTLQPISNLGPGQRGGSPAQWAAENTLAVNNAAAAYRNSRQAVSTQLAGQGGGGTSGLQSGISQQISGTLASQAENNLSNLTQENLIHDYDVGNQNFWKATGGEQTLGNSEDALQFGQGAEGANQNAFSQADKINTENGTVLGDIGKVIGLGAGAAGSFLTGGVSNVLAGGANAGSGNSGGVGNFFSGGFDALSGNK